jgi:acetyl esterase
VLSLPDPLLARIIGASPVVRDGRVLDRRVQALIVLGERLGLTGEEWDVGRRRTQFRRGTQLVMPRRLGVHVSDRMIPRPGGDLAVRVYRRLGSLTEAPAIVYFHGGGWVIGDLDTHDGAGRLLADVTGCVVVAVDYRLAPEHPFPAAVDDALAAYRWVQEHPGELGAQPGRVGVMGDSAGGNLAAVVARVTRDDDVPAPVAQCLVYPATDAHFDTRSHELFADGFFLTRADMEWFRGHYLPDPADWDSPLASPLLEPDLSGVAPALVVTAGFDPLRDEGRAYADRLADAGVPVRYRCYDDLVHGFFGMGILPEGMAVATEICAAMGELMSAPAPTG